MMRRLYTALSLAAPLIREAIPWLTIGAVFAMTLALMGAPI